MSEPRNGYVTWKGLITTVIGAATVVLSLTLSVIGWGWNVHISQPHPGALTEQEYSRDFGQLEKRLVRIEDKVDKLRTELKQ